MRGPAATQTIECLVFKDHLSFIIALAYCTTQARTDHSDEHVDGIIRASEDDQGIENDGQRRGDLFQEAMLIISSMPPSPTHKGPHQKKKFERFLF